MTRAILGLFRWQASSDSRRLFLPSPHEIMTAAGLAAAAIAVGAVAWSGQVLALPVACLFPLLWSFAPTRRVAALVSMAYFLAASRGLPEGASNYFDIGLTTSIGLWIAASLSFVLVHTVLWTPNAGWRRPVRYGIAAILMSVPPFGIVGWASPITAAGVLFPGWGWFGLAATASGLLVLTTRFWPIAALALGGAFAWSSASWTAPSLPDGWQGINSNVTYSGKEKSNSLEQHMATIAMVKGAAEEGYLVVVLPESALGVWTQTAEHLWVKNLANTDATILGGAVVVGKDGYDNVIVKITGRGSEIIYRQRMPVPLSMWRPWTRGGAKAYFFGNPSFEVAGVRIAPLICYEQLLVWPIIRSMLFRPQVIVAIGNAWWVGDANIVVVQNASVNAWAALFRVFLVEAANT